MAYQILIVDDDNEFRHEMRECLEGDYKVIEASNGETALAILNKPNAIDLVVLDVMMPGMLGTDVLRIIKKTKPNLLTIILTGESSKEVAIDALKNRADDYIEKPFQIKEFLSTIQSLLSAKAVKDFAHPKGIHAKIEQSRQFIERNYDKKVTLEDMAAQVNLSPKYFSRVFKEITGEGFNEYRLGIKVKKAAELLKTSDYTVGEIAAKFGYQNIESFIRVFSKITGKTPTQYRLKNQTKRPSAVRNSK